MFNFETLNFGNKKKNTRRGSALIVALVITGLLSLVTIGISSLIARETRIINDLLGRETTYYAAEAGLEVGLLQLENDVNYVIPESARVLQADVRGQDIVWNAVVTEKTNHIPVLTDSEKRYFEIQDPRGLYVPLDHNQSVKIRLDDSLQDFMLEYYYPLGSDIELVTNLANLDILRFKLFGRANDGTFESINEFYPVARPHSLQSGLTANDPGIVGSTTQHPEFGDIEVWNGGKLFVSDPNKVTRCTAFDQSCDEPDQQPNVNIGEFLATHTDRYIIITNLVDPVRVQGQGVLGNQARLYYRVRDLSGSGSNGLYAPSAMITAKGDFGNYEKDLSVNIAPDTFLPIFDFALYRPAEAR